MNRTVLAIGLAAFIVGGAFAQPAADALSFEVASVKPAPPPTGDRIRVGISGGPGTPDPGRITYSNVPLKAIVATAYNVKPNQVSGPGWIESDRFDIMAKLPPGTTKEQVPLMLQTLLKERFKLAVHREKKEMPVYALLVAKNGPKMKESLDDGSATAGAQQAAAPPPPPPLHDGPMALGKDGFPQMPGGGRRGTYIMMMPGKARMVANKQSISGFIDMLGGQLGRPILDLTELKGTYDFTLEWAPEGRMPGPFGGAPPHVPPGGGAVAEAGPPIASATDGAGPSIFTAVQEQLGLKLESRKGPVDLVVIDHAERTPTEN